MIDIRRVLDKHSKAKPARSLSAEEARLDNWYRTISHCFSRLNFALQSKKQSEGLTQAELARRLGKDKSYISKALSGSRNITLRSMCDIAHAAGYQTLIEFVPLQVAENGAAICFKQNPGVLIVVGHQDTDARSSSANTYRQSKTQSDKLPYSPREQSHTRKSKAFRA